MSKHYVIVSHGEIIQGPKNQFSPVNINSKLYFYVNEGCMLGIFKSNDRRYISSEIKKSICDEDFGHKDVTLYNEEYSNLSLYPLDSYSQIIIQDCNSRDNILRLSNKKFYTLATIIALIETYHNQRYSAMPYILHVFACRGYANDPMPSVGIMRSISGNRAEEMRYIFTKSGLKKYFRTIKDIQSEDLRKQYLDEIRSIITPDNFYIIDSLGKVIIDLDKYDKLVILGENLGLKKTDIDLYQAERFLESKRFQPYSRPPGPPTSPRLSRKSATPFRSSHSPSPSPTPREQLPQWSPSPREQSSTPFQWSPPPREQLPQWSPTPREQSATPFPRSPREQSYTPQPKEPDNWKYKYLKYKKKYLNLKNHL